MRKFPGQALNPCHKSDLSHNSDNANPQPTEPPENSMNVLKHRFYYYSGMVRLIDKEMTAIEKIVYYTLRFQEKGTYHTIAEWEGWGTGRH